MAEEHEMAEQGPGRRSNRLPLPQQMTAAAWLKERVEEAARVPKAQIAAALAAHLGRPVSVKNLEHVAEAAGVRLHSYMPEPGMLQKRVDGLEERVNKLDEVLDTLQQRMAREGARA